ncbi:hypothetical protein NW066_03860 [Mycoplasmopsis felis]|nr:hypothetical protein [Mycoplasmopsis felis]UWV84730.1 hypothetical protein NW066_03860 [Mycoplasmopsis felis]
MNSPFLKALFLFKNSLNWLIFSFHLSLNVSSLISIIKSNQYKNVLAP